MRALSKAAPYIIGAIVIIGMANFFWFWFESVHLGGDALNGYARDGQYFVGSHGAYTEVTRQQ